METVDKNLLQMNFGEPSPICKNCRGELLAVRSSTNTKGRSGGNAASPPLLLLIPRNLLPQHIPIKPREKRRIPLRRGGERREPLAIPT